MKDTNLKHRVAHRWEKRAGNDLGSYVMPKVIDRAEFGAIRSALSKIKDHQTLDLLRSIMTRFHSMFDVSSLEADAFFRFMNLLGSKTRDPDNIRNQVFKIANSLEIKLPNSMF